MDIAEQMLIAGAEVHRVEDSIRRMCHALGARRTDMFVITSNLIVTIYDEHNAAFTQTRRVHTGNTDIERLHRLNTLSRRICRERLTLDEIREDYAAILKTKSYPFWAECLAFALIAGAFALFFGGNFWEAAVSFAVGALLRPAVWFCDRAGMNRVFAKFLCSFLSTALAFSALKCGCIASVDKVIIGNIMTLIPGVGLTNSLRDLFTGDSMTAILRMIEAVLIALAIGAGYFSFVFLMGGVGA